MAYKDKTITKKQFEAYWKIRYAVNKASRSHDEWIPLQKDETGLEFGDYWKTHYHPDGKEIELYGETWTIPINFRVELNNFWGKLLNSNLPEDEKIIHHYQMKYLNDKWNVLYEIYMLKLAPKDRMAL